MAMTSGSTGKRFTPPPWDPKERTTQNEVSWLIIRNGPGRDFVVAVRVLCTQKDLEQLVPALERLMRGPRNPNFSFEVKEAK